jgi:hypothetical protein
MSTGKDACRPVRGKRHRRAGRCGRPARHRYRCAALIPGRGNLPPGGWHARKFASSQVTLMIRKEGTYVRAMRIAPARQLTLDIPWAGRGRDRDREQVWNQMPDAARARVLRLLAAMIAAGVLTGDGGCQDAGAVRDDG